MTDRTDHRREAGIHRELAGQVLGHEGTMEHLAYAAVHALLAIHDALTAADAANEARQREEEQMEDAWQFRDWETVSRLQDEARQREASLSLTPSTDATVSDSEPDPLDENDHRDRLLSDGRRIVRHGCGHWHTPAIYGKWCDDDCTEMSLQDWAHRFAPLTFVPDVTPGTSPVDLTISAVENDAVEGGRAAGQSEALLCPECRHDIDSHPHGDEYEGYCECDWHPSDIARLLIAQAPSGPPT